MTDLHTPGGANQPLLFDIENDVAFLTLNRPAQGNSLSPDLLEALAEAWARVENTPHIRVAVVTGAGTKHFCTGAAVDALKEGRGGLVDEPYEVANRFSPRMCGVTKPVICALNGLVNGGGLHFVADCDIIVAHKDVAFMDTHVNLGQVFALEAVGIVRLAGVGAALLMGLVGRHYRMDAARAYQLGLIDFLEATGAEVTERAQQLASQIAENSPSAIARTKRAIWGATEMLDPAAAQHGWDLLKSQWAHPDFEEGPKAYLEKRTPVWNPDSKTSR